MKDKVQGYDCQDVNEARKTKQLHAIYDKATSLYDSEMLACDGACGSKCDWIPETIKSVIVKLIDC